MHVTNRNINLEHEDGYMVVRNRLKRFASGKVPLAIEKTSGMNLNSILDGIAGGESETVSEVFKASEKPFESKRSAINEVFPRGAIFGHKK